MDNITANAPVSPVMDYVIRQLTPEDEELTPTMKLKRKFVNQRYAAEIDAMYRDRAVA